MFHIIISNYFRFLSECRCHQSQLQLAASACLLISFKMSPLDVSVSELVEYTDNCFTEEEMRSWELLVAVKLDWNLRIDTPLKHIRHLLESTGLTHLWTKAVELTITSSQDATLSHVDKTTLAVAVYELTAEKYNRMSSSKIEHDMFCLKTTVKDKLQRLMVEEFDSGCESSRGSDFFTSNSEFYTDFKDLSSKIHNGSQLFISTYL